VDKENPIKKNEIRKKYSPQFKDQAVDRAAKDGIFQVAKDLGIAESMFYYWCSQKSKGGDTIENQNFSKLKCLSLS
jgi:transposase